MIKPVLISIVPTTIIVAPWLISSKELILFSEPVALVLIGLTLIGLANIGRNMSKKG
jgi:hypothetical protein